VKWNDAEVMQAVAVTCDYTHRVASCQ